MSRLLLLRHAKAAWAAPGERDFDRPLKKSGWTDSRDIGEQIAAMSLIPDIILCSTARRARETWAGVAEVIGSMDDRVTFLDQLYTEDAAGYLEVARNAPEASSVMLVGHNPMMEDLAEALSGSGKDAARSILAAGFPKSGLAVIAFDGPLSQAQPGKGRLELFLTKRREAQV
ncbi:MAG: histidine phosphatase family protein [Rhizobiaceae bacterium]|nr:histidine phosphatase family protein [Rhizobiaceae bacterium]